MTQTVFKGEILRNISPVEPAKPAHRVQLLLDKPGGTILSGIADIARGLQVVFQILKQWEGGHLTQSAWGKFAGKLHSMRQLQSGWDSYRGESPTVTALVNVEQFLSALKAERFMPSRLAPSVVGGVGVTFRRGEKKVYVEFYNNGKVCALFSDITEEPRVEDYQTDAIGYQLLIRKAREYLDA